MKGAEEKAVEINVGSRDLSVALNWTSRKRGSRLSERRGVVTVTSVDNRLKVVVEDMSKFCPVYQV